ncbi:DUF6113 family protein [Streptosporangium sp. NPDC000095]|uniref:DUF6113 family protein n=1 Tax=Streptosporangium sp. NPDC000095 TaxID=3366184 RepID=UPI00369D4064
MLVMEQVPAVRAPSETVVAVATNAVLFVLGLLLGVLGGFQHSWYIRPVPVSAVVCLALLFAIPYGAGRMTHGKSAAVAFVAGWALITMIWISGRPEGDLVIANDLSGYLYLYGGLAAVTVGIMLSPSATLGGTWPPTSDGYRSGPESAPIPSDSPPPSGSPSGSPPSPATSDPGIPPGPAQSGAVASGSAQSGSVASGSAQSGSVASGSARSGAVPPDSVVPGSVQPDRTGPDQTPPGRVPPGSQTPPAPPGTSAP